MSHDLDDLFRDAYRSAPAPVLDADAIVRRGRRVRARRRVAAGATAAVGIGVVAVGSTAVAASLHAGPGPVGAAAGGGSSATPTSSDAASVTATQAPTPTPSSVTVTAGSPTPEQASPTPCLTVSVPISGKPCPVPSDVSIGLTPEVRPAGIDAVALPDPAPGFPLRRWTDGVEPSAGMGQSSTTYYVATFGLAVTPGRTLSDGSTQPTGPEITLFVGDFPMPAVSGGRIEGHDVVASPTVHGVTGHVTSWTEKGTPMHDLYFSTGTFTVAVHGFGDVTTAQLVALGDALTGLR